MKSGISCSVSGEEKGKQIMFLFYGFLRLIQINPQKLQKTVSICRTEISGEWKLAAASERQEIHLSNAQIRHLN